MRHLSLFLTLIFIYRCLSQPSSIIRHFVINETTAMQQAFDQMSKECTKNGKTFKEGETFEFGNLRYKCQKYGVYTIEGCQTNDKKPIALGESTVINNVKHQCLAAGNSIHYRQTVCGIMGQPECDQVPLPSHFEEAKEKALKENNAMPVLKTANVPEGWKVIDGGSVKIPNSNATVITRILMFNSIPIPKLSMTRRMRRQTTFKGQGIPSILGVEEVGSDSGKPMMPMDMLIKSSHEMKIPGKSSNSNNHIGMQGIEKMSRMNTHQMDLDKEQKVAVQTIGAKLTMRLINNGKEMHQDSTYPKPLSHVDGQKMKYKPGTIIGQRSYVDWSGQLKTINQKPIFVGAGNFKFGTRKTSN